MLLEVSEVAKKLPGNLWKALANCDVPFPKKNLTIVFASAI